MQILFLKQIVAYIDPGTGSIIIQATIGAALGIAIIAKLFWYRILKFFGIRKKEKPENVTEDRSKEKK